MNKTVGFLYGFSEGWWHGRRFKKVLRAQGYALTRKPAQADIIIAHSGGCYYAHPVSESQQIILINPTYWPGKSMQERAKLKISTDFKAIFSLPPDLYILYKNTWNCIYLVLYLPVWIRMRKTAKSYNLEKVLQHHKNTVVVRNNDDPWLTPDLDKLKNANPAVRFFHLPGTHDTCWRTPLPYLQFLDR